ncbi:SurE family 5'-nucleotidase [Paramixta manurensis]|uniref:5'-nucleotidase n=1 Tax=Paramixta manurensis TaxID=2740817 RepID=A0A6M8UA18_9GAMM|nr:SurE family 5'-nucleotidase [Erwiniaceae bacterium PD-1]
MKATFIITALIGALSFTVQAAERPMRILLVNDDGCESYGTTALQSKLKANGFEVWLVAPATNQSGIGSAITFKPNKVFDVRKVAEKQYCFPGTPADAVDYGLLGVMRDAPPDLIISGVNDGPNTGVAQLNSGTISAAARAVRYGYPAIAASIGYKLTDEEAKNGWPSTKKYWPESVDHVVELVANLNKHWQPGQPILPAGSGLSINYPALPKNKINGIKWVANEFYPVPQHYYKLLDDGRAQQILSDEILKPADADTDSGWLQRGYIIYTVIDGDWNAPAQKVEQYQRLLKR